MENQSCADSWDTLVNMASLYNVNHDSAYAVQQRSLGDFQFELENVLTMSQLIGKSAEERNAGLGDAGHPCWYQEQDCSRVYGRDRHSRAKTQWTKRAVRAANTSGRAKVIVREDNTTKNEAWASGQAARKV